MPATDAAEVVQSQTKSTTRRRKTTGGCSSRDVRRRKENIPPKGPIVRVLSSLADSLMGPVGRLPSPWAFKDRGVEKHFQEDFKLLCMPRARLVVKLTIATFGLAWLTMWAGQVYDFCRSTAGVPASIEEIQAAIGRVDLTSFDMSGHDGDEAVYAGMAIFTTCAHLAVVLSLDSGANSASSEIAHLSNWGARVAFFCLMTGVGIGMVNYSLLSLVDSLLSSQVQSTMEERLFGMFVLFIGFVVPLAERNFEGEELKIALLLQVIGGLIAWMSYGAQRWQFLQQMAAGTLDRNLKANLQKLDQGFGEVTENYFSVEQLECMKLELEQEFASIAKRQASRRIEKDPGLYWVRSEILGKTKEVVVHAAVDRKTGEKLACKCARVDSQRRQGVLENELRILQVIQHPNIVGYRCSVKESGFIKVFMELCEVGSLHRVLRGGVLEEWIVRHCCAQILAGLHYLHAIGICHADIKPGNILVTDGKLKIGDMGSSFWVHTKSAQPKTGGTDMFLPPEVKDGKQKSTRKGDIFALGVVTCLMLCMTVPGWQSASGEKESPKPRSKENSRQHIHEQSPAPSPTATKPPLQPGCEKEPGGGRQQSEGFVSNAAERILTGSFQRIVNENCACKAPEIGDANIQGASGAQGRASSKEGSQVGAEPLKTTSSTLSRSTKSFSASTITSTVDALDISDSARSFLHACLNLDPGLRPNCLELRQHEFVKDQYVESIPTPRLCLPQPLKIPITSRPNFLAYLVEVIRQYEGVFESQDLENKFQDYFRQTVTCSVGRFCQTVLIPFSFSMTILTGIGVLPGKSCGYSVAGMDALIILRILGGFCLYWFQRVYPFFFQPRTTEEHRTLNMVLDVMRCIHIITQDYETIQQFLFGALVLLATPALSGSLKSSWRISIVWNLAGCTRYWWNCRNHMQDASSEFLATLSIRSLVLFVHLAYAVMFFQFFRQSWIQKHYSLTKGRDLMAFSARIHPS